MLGNKLCNICIGILSLFMSINAYGSYNFDKKNSIYGSLHLTEKFNNGERKTNTGAWFGYTHNFIEKEHDRIIKGKSTPWCEVSPCYKCKENCFK